MQLLWLVAEFIKVDVADVDDKVCVSLCRQVIASPSRERGAMVVDVRCVRVRVRVCRCACERPTVRACMDASVRGLCGQPWHCTRAAGYSG